MGKAQHQREAAQFAALAQFYDAHGFLPEGCGFEIVDDGFEPINTSGSLDAIGSWFVIAVQGGTLRKLIASSFNELLNMILECGATKTV